MSKSTADSDEMDMQVLIDHLVDVGRRGGSAGVQEFINHGGFDLAAFLRDFECGWRLLLRYPLVWLRHKRWIASCRGARVSSMADWEVLNAAEKNIAIAEFGQRRLDRQERMRLRNIRQGHKQSWWEFCALLNSLAVISPNGRIELRAPPKRTTQVLGGIRRLWTATCFYLLIDATSRFISRGCLTCDVAGIYMLVPIMFVAWWFFHLCSDGWWKAWNKLNKMAVGSMSNIQGPLTIDTVR